MIDFEDDFESDDENPIPLEKPNEYDVEAMILHESKKIKEKSNENEDFHEMIVCTLSPVKEKVR